MCWNPMPSSQVFESGKAQEIGNRLVADIYNYTSQKDAQIQALTKEIGDLKVTITHYRKGHIKLQDKVDELKEVGNKMAEALNATNDYFEGSHKYTSEDIVEMKNKSLSEWEKLNK